MKSAIEWKPDSPVGENLVEFLPPLIGEFFAIGRQIVAGPAKPKELHQFRLRAKRLRYTLELFEPLYGERFADPLEQLRRLQNLLGKINDCEATRALLRRNRGVGRKSKRRRVMQLLKRRQANRTRKALDFWRDEFDRDSVEEHWIQLVSPEAGSFNISP